MDVWDIDIHPVRSGARRRCAGSDGDVIIAVFVVGAVGIIFIPTRALKAKGEGNGSTEDCSRCGQQRRVPSEKTVRMHWAEAVP
jgi:hypothetical protein